MPVMQATILFNFEHRLHNVQCIWSTVPNSTVRYYYK